MTAAALVLALVSAQLGQEFRLAKGQTASLESGRVLVRLVKFINSPCPKGAYCVWSGQAVITELTVDGKVVKESVNDRPYDVLIKDSDYRTFAVLVVEEPASACSTGKQPGECFRSLAKRRSEPALCRRIEDERTRGFCLEDLAEALEKDALCVEVSSPTQHCLYVKARKAGDPALCAGIVTWTARERCLKELSR